jgi:O-antigen ligase
LLVLGIHFVRKTGPWALVAGCVVAPPMVLFGGRTGTEAEQSSGERSELLREAFQFIRDTKGIGLGVGAFPDASSIGLTAHNSYVLAAAETGMIGMFLFGLAVYLAVKVPWVIWFGRYDVSRPVERFAPALAITSSGAVLGIFFLSWTYKDILWMVFGASGALYAAARGEDPRVEVRLRPREVVLVALSLLGMLAVAYVATRFSRQR